MTSYTARTAAEVTARRGSLLAWLLRGNSLLRTGHLLTVSALAASVLGAGYWALATRLYGTETVGHNYAAISAMTLIAGVGQLNLPEVFIRFVAPAGPRARRLVLSCYAASAAATLALVTTFVLVIPWLLPGLGFLHTPGLGAAFILSTVVYSLFALQDGVLTGLRRPGIVVVENASFATVKILALVALATTGAGILLSWTVALTAAVAGTSAYLFTRALPRRDAVPAPTRTPSPTRRFIVPSYIGSLCGTIAMTLPPLLVLDRLGATQNAYFSLTWVVAQVLFLFNRNMGTSLVVEVAQDAQGLRQLGRMVRYGGLFLVSGVVVLVAAAPLVLRVFGPGYAQHGTTLFRLLVLAALPDFVCATALSVAYARRRLTLVVAIFAGLAAGVIGLTLLWMPSMRIDAVGAAWLCTESAIAAVLLATRSRWLPRTAHAANGHHAAPALPPAPVEHAGAADASAQAEARLPTLTVVICAYTVDRWTDLIAAVASVRGQLPPAEEIVVVIDHCPPLAERAAAEIDGVRVVANREQRGLSGARNTGIREARSDIVAFLDDDAVAEPGWAAHLLAGYTDSRVLGVGGQIRPRWDTSRPEWFPAEFDWVVGCTYHGMPAGRARVRNLIGANMSFRRAVLEKAEGFRADLGRVGTVPLGCEETEFCIRAAAENPGGILLHEPAAAVGHRVPAARATWSYFRSRCYAEGLSKAAVARHAGAGRALATERAYLRSVIPAAMLRALRVGSDHWNPVRAAVLMAAVCATTTGYTVGCAKGSPLVARLRRSGAKDQSEDIL